MRVDIPIEHLDFDYVNKCEEHRTLARMLRLLRSGKHGRFTALEESVLNRLKTICPQHVLIREENLPTCLESLEESHLREVDDFIENARANEPSTFTDPPNISLQATSHFENGALLRPVKDWFNITREIISTCCEKNEKFISKDNNLKSKQDESDIFEKVRCWLEPKMRLIPDKIKSRLSIEEREKGNECYKAQQYANAITHYCKSIVYHPTSKAYSNRAACYIKLVKYECARKDCETALALDAQNVKGTCDVTVINKFDVENFEASIHYATTLIKLGNYLDAKDVLTKLERAGPSNQKVQCLIQQLKRRKNTNGKVIIEEV